MKDMSIKMGADKSLVTHAVSHLMENELVEDISKSKKIYSLVLTEKGKNEMRVIQDSIDSINSYLTSDLTPEELEAFERLYEKIDKKLRDQFLYRS